MFVEENSVFMEEQGENYLPERRTVGNLFPGRRLAEETAPAPWTVFRQHVRDNSNDWRFSAGAEEYDSINEAMEGDLIELANEVAAHTRSQEAVNKQTALSRTFMGIMIALILIIILLFTLKSA